MAIPAIAAQHMMAIFRKEQAKSMFLSNLFKTIKGSTGSTGETIIWDEVHGSDEIANAVTPGTGSNLNTVDDFTTKETIPCQIGEATVVRVNDLVQRLAGENPFAAGNRKYISRFTDKITRALVAMNDKIGRTAEFMASQVLQTGEISIPGSVPYIEDFFPKATHFPTVAVNWSDKVNGVPLFDLEALADVIQTDSNAVSVKAVFGRIALQNFLESDQVKEMANLRRINLINIDPSMAERGAIRYGSVNVGSYELEIWSYNAKYEPAGGGTKLPFVAEDKVILLPDKPNLVVASTIVPNVLPPDPRVSGFVSLPTKAEGGWDLQPNIWCDAEGKTIYAGFTANLVLLPHSIDRIGCLDTVI